MATKHEGLIVSGLTVVFMLSAWAIGWYQGRRFTLKQFIDVARDPKALDLTTAVARHKMKSTDKKEMEKELQDVVDERINYYTNKTKQKHDI